MGAGPCLSRPLKQGRQLQAGLGFEAGGSRILKHVGIDFGRTRGDIGGTGPGGKEVEDISTFYSSPSPETSKDHQLDFAETSLHWFAETCFEQPQLALWQGSRV